MVKIGCTSLNIKGKYAGGNLNNKCIIQSWYNRPWIKIMRPNNPDTANDLSYYIEKLCNNDNIECNINAEPNLYSILKEYDWDINKIQTKCYTNSIELIAVCAQCSGLRVPQKATLNNISNYLKRTGKFNILESEIYFNTSDYLKHGDVIIAKDHIAIVLNDGVENRKTEDNQENIGTISALRPVRVRSGPGPQYKIIGVVKAGQELQLLSLLDNDWCKIYWNQSNSKYAYVNGEYFDFNEQKPLNKNSIIVNQNRKIINTVDIKKSPEENSPIIGTAEKNSVYTIIRINNNWGNIRSNGGWIPLDSTIKI